MRNYVKKTVGKCKKRKLYASLLLVYWIYWFEISFSFIVIQKFQVCNCKKNLTMKQITSSSVSIIKRKDIGVENRVDVFVKKRYNFTDLFYSDESAAKNLLSLYNALYGTDFTNPNIVDKVWLEDVIFMNFKNDLAALFNQKRLFLAEQQSTVNDNMPLRMLMYVGREYEKLVDSTLRYRKRMVKIPTPQFVTFYNGTEPYSTERILRLSDAFTEADEKPELDLQVRVININIHSGAGILEKCSILREYSVFTDTARKRREANSSNGLEQAVKECIANGILSEYLTKKSTEVINMLTEEYDYQKDINVTREEEHWNTLVEILHNLMNSLHTTAEDAMDKMGVAPEQRAILRKML